MAFTVSENQILFSDEETAEKTTTLQKDNV